MNEKSEYGAVSDVKHAEEMFGFSVDKFLRSRGWKHTSSTPGCYWLWEREWKGKTLLVSRDLALSMEDQFEGERQDEACGRGEHLFDSGSGECPDDFCAHCGTPRE